MYTSSNRFIKFSLSIVNRSVNNATVPALLHAKSNVSQQEHYRGDGPGQLMEDFNNEQVNIKKFIFDKDNGF